MPGFHNPVSSGDTLSLKAPGLYAGRHQATETMPKCLDSSTQRAPAHLEALYAGRHQATETVPKCLDSNTQRAPAHPDPQSSGDCTREGLRPPRQCLNAWIPAPRELLRHFDLPTREGIRAPRQWRNGTKCFVGLTRIIIFFTGTSSDSRE